MALSKKKQDELIHRMHALQIHEEDLLEKFILGSGPGGQKVNKTASSVYIKHLPTGIEVKCSQYRSQELNRYLARRLLCEAFESKLFGIKSSKQQEQNKIRKQKKRKARKRKSTQELTE